MIVTLNIIIIALCVVILGVLISIMHTQPSNDKSLAIKKCMKKGYAVITLTNRGKSYNFLLDSASNISHICSEYLQDLDIVQRGKLNDEIAGFGGTTKRSEYCIVKFKDRLHNKYQTVLSVSDNLSSALKGFEQNTSTVIHGLLGTDFLKKYECVIDYSTLKVYPRKDESDLSCNSTN